MQNRSVWARLLGLTRAVVERVWLEEETESIVVSVRPTKGAQRRCGQCGRRSGLYDRGEGRRRWRALDVGELRCYLEADAPRVRCRVHGVTVSEVPWARHGAGHTRAFDDTVAWLAIQCSKSAVTELMRVAWRSVGAIVTRVQDDVDATIDRLAGLTRIGIDEISYKRHHRYLTVVVDHDSGRLVWAAAGRDAATLREFFALLGAERCAAITHVSADQAEWIAKAVGEACPQAVQCADPFHIVAWATEALDVVRREVWNAAGGRRRIDQATGRPGVATGEARSVKRARYALWKNPENLTEHQAARLEWIAKTDPRLYRAYLLKEGLRHAFVVKGEAGKEALDRWTSWARRCRIPAFVELQRKIVRHRKAIDATLDHGLSNGLIESTNTKIRLLTRIAFGFRSPEALIALALLALGGHRPVLPGRIRPTE
ncbi:MAG: ISL3 family transposase [Acidimicrobiales bacterium]